MSSSTARTREATSERTSTDSLRGDGSIRAASVAKSSESSGSLSSSVSASAESSRERARSAWSRASCRCESAQPARASVPASATSASTATTASRRWRRFGGGALRLELPPVAPGEHGRREHVVEDLVARRPAAPAGRRDGGSAPRRAWRAPARAPPARPSRTARDRRRRARSSCRTASRGG